MKVCLDPIHLAILSTDHTLSLGMAESLWRETQPLGIQTLLIEPGRFRTLLLSSQNRRDARSSIPEYADADEDFFETLTAASERQPGDVKKGVSIIADVVRKEGVAKGRTVPFRLQLGTDCYDLVKEKYEGLLKDMDDWKDVITSTEHAD